MPLPSRRRSILFILPLQTKPAKLGNWAFPKTAPSANHDINELSGSGLLLGPAPLPNVIRLALSPCHDLAAMASFAPSMLQSSPSDTICISAVRVPRLAIPLSPTTRQPKAHISVASSVSICRSRPSSPNSTEPDRCDCHCECHQPRNLACSSRDRYRWVAPSRVLPGFR